MSIPNPSTIPLDATCRGCGTNLVREGKHLYCPGCFGNASRELDALVAEKVMGFDTSQLKTMPIACPDGRPGCCVVHYDTFFANGSSLPPYSTSIAAAWEIVEKRVSEAKSTDNDFALVWEPEQNTWCAQFDGIQAFADTAPLAICRAALKAVWS